MKIIVQDCILLSIIIKNVASVFFHYNCFDIINVVSEKKKFHNLNESFKKTRRVGRRRRAQSITV